LRVFPGSPPIALLLSAVKNHTECGDGSLGYERGPVWGPFFGLSGSERLIVDFAGGSIGVGVQVFEFDGERPAGRGLGLFGDHGLAPRR
jgi:hypothetical protein